MAGSKKMVQTSKKDDADDEATSSEDSDDNSSDNSRLSKRLPGLKMRTPPKALAHAVEQMNPKQKKAVEELGFGSIQKFRINAVPQKLAYWLLENLDTQSREIKLNNGRRLHFDAEDKVMNVARVVQESERPSESEGEELNDDSQKQTSVPDETENNTIVDPPNTWNATRRMSEFIDRVKNEMNAFPWVKLSEVEMFFFPIYQMNHFFFICIDLKDMESVIIDNSTAMEKENDGLKLKYGDIPSPLIKYFIEYTKKAGLLQRSKEIKKFHLLLI
ncbi:hypothetical protein C2S52_008206 [Perilla frutescens var. hirtella]|nr:hypothetical protein C2S52_008206 [Perilla frutescens var. hirtella]